MKITRLTFALSFLSAFASAAAQTSPSKSDLTENPVYEKNCAKCHGKTAEGRHFGGPSLISDKTLATPADDLRNVISNGKRRMPKYTGKLTPEEIDTLVGQILAMKK